MKELSRTMVSALGVASARRGPRAVAATAPADKARNSRRVLMRSSGARRVCGGTWFRDSRRAGRGLSRPAGPPVKYLLKIDRSCLDGQPGCPGGEADDSTQRREGAAAVPVAGATAAHGASLCAAAWPHGGRETIRGQYQDDSALASAVAARRPARAGAALSPAPRPPHRAPSHRAHWPSAPRPGVRGAAHPTVVAPDPRGARGGGHDPADLPGYRPGPPAPDPEAGTPADEVVRESGAWRKRPGRREIREDRGPLGLSVHRPR